LSLDFKYLYENAPKMKKLLKFTFLIFISFAQKSFAQKLEISAALNSGWYHYIGAGSTNASFLNAATLNGNIINYTNNPYGRQFALSYGLSANTKFIFKNNILLGIDLGFERLRGKTRITRVADTSPSGLTADIAATGNTFLKSDVVNVCPNFGYRIGKGQTTVDFSVGLDIALILSIKEKGSALAVNGKEYASNLDRKTINTDTRPRLQIGLNYRNVGIYTGYAFGLSDFKEGFTGGGDQRVRSGMLRFGLSYKVF